jgi:hypothetical protein
MMMGSMGRLSPWLVAVAAVAPWPALAQAAQRDTAPLAPLWIAVSFIVVVALLALLLRDPRAAARSHAAARRRARR